VSLKGHVEDQQQQRWREGGGRVDKGERTKEERWSGPVAVHFLRRVLANAQLGKAPGEIFGEDDVEKLCT
jgi:hypothetical protein